MITRRVSYLDSGSSRSTLNGKPVSIGMDNRPANGTRVVVEGLGLMGMAVARRFRMGRETLCFISSNHTRIERLQSTYQYKVTGSTATVVRKVHNVQAVCTNNTKACAQAYRDACRVIVALHPHAITDRVTGLAAARMLPVATALRHRFTCAAAKPLLFVLISNDRDSGSVFMQALRQAIDIECGHRVDIKERINQGLRISSTVTEQRAIPVKRAFETGSAHPLVETEPDMEIILEQARCFNKKGERSGRSDCANYLGEIEDVRVVENFAAYKDRKLIASNGAHLYVAVHASIAGLKTIDQGIANPAIREGLEGLLDNEIYPCLHARHPGAFSDSEITRHRAMLIHRFADPGFSDDVTRVARNIIKKLSLNERLVGALILCLMHGINAPKLQRAIAAALRFGETSAEGADSASLQIRIMQEGPEKTLGTVSGLCSQQGRLKSPAEAALRDIVAEYYRLRQAPASTSQPPAGQGQETLAV